MSAEAKFGIGSIFGATAGYFGGLYETIVMRVMDIIMAVPGTLMAVSVLVPLALVMWWRKRQDARDRKRLDAQTARLLVSGGGQ